MQKITLISQQSEIRLDKYLVSMLPEYSRTFLQNLIKEGFVEINNKVIKSSHYLVSSGEKIILKIKNQNSDIPLQNIPLKIVYEDKDIIVIDKQPNLVVHPPNEHHLNGTLVNALLNYTSQLSDYGGKLKRGIVHRLDKDTSGIMIIAKNNTAHKNLNKQFADHKVQKTYLALLAGIIKPEKGGIEAPVGRSKKDRLKMSILTKGKYALSYYKVKKYFSDSSLVEIRILTGRTHQIRLHFSSIGFFVLGDKLYGNKKINDEFEKIGLNRQFLHAFSLKFKHPRLKKTLHFISELPNDLKCVLDNLNR